MSAALQIGCNLPVWGLSDGRAGAGGRLCCGDGRAAPRPSQSNAVLVLMIWILPDLTFLLMPLLTRVSHIFICAGKAWLKGLSPKENRDIPPLDYDRAEALQARCLICIFI